MSAAGIAVRPVAPLPPDVFEALVTALAGALVADYRAENDGMVGSPRGLDRVPGGAGGGLYLVCGKDRSDG